uniref:RNB domain-containing protein n=1 Tax=Macrostomum lignano TaxID=282301 RepID=A0A1I8HXJ3_9PLAT
ASPQQQQQCGNNSTSNGASSTAASVPLVFRPGCPPEGAGAQLQGPPLPGAQTQLHGGGGANGASSQFVAHLTPEEVSAGLASGELITGQVRISQRNFEEAFVSHPNGDSDILITSLIDRNRALNDDEVALRIKPFGQQQQPPTVESVLASGQATFAALFPGVVYPDSRGDDDGEGEGDNGEESAIAAILKSNADPCQPLPVDKVQRIGQVVAIVRQLANRRFVGYVKPGNSSNQPMVLFAPLDSRQPRCLVPRSDLPPMFASRPGDFERTLFVAELANDWRPECRMPQVRISRQLGNRAAGRIDLELETRVILEHHSIDAEDFEPDTLAEVAEISADIDSEEVARRRDFRDPSRYCVFTVDPETARDLDDAVGVHIADVSHYVRPGSKVDAVARARATTTYLVQRAYPMLPRRLCEQLCSLNPREDKLAFSVVWRIDPNSCEVKSTWFGKSIIRSCCQLSYQHAQHFIEGHSDMREPQEVDLGGDAQMADAAGQKESGSNTTEEVALMSDLRRASARVEAPHTVQSVADSVRAMHSLAVKLRRQRFSDGALRIDQPRLTFRLAEAPTDGADAGASAPPIAFSVYELRDSNRMIEEFMLLANCSVAHKLRDSQPDLAFLRRHMPPSERALQALKKTSSALGVQLDVLDSEQHLCLLSLCAKQMQLAKYFCIGSAKHPDLWRHYALNVPLYTHFTSPIRRYADVVVHRQLCAAVCSDSGLELDQSIVQLAETVESLTDQAQVCNKKKKDAKEAGERSIDLHYAAFVIANGPLDEVGVVIGVLDKAMDVLLTRCGLVRRLYMDQQAPMLRKSHEFRAGAVQGCGQLSLHFNGCHSASHHLTLCPMSTIEVVVSSCLSKDDPMRLKLLLKPPSCDLCDDTPVGTGC